MPEPVLPFGPRYRYFSVPPETLTLRLADLADALPDAARRPAFSPYHSITLSCSEIFTGAVPRISLVRLAELAPDSVTAEGFADHSVSLPAARLARSYQLVQERELLEEPAPPPAPEPEPIRAEPEIPAAVDAPKPPAIPAAPIGSPDEDFAPPAAPAPASKAPLFTPPPPPVPVASAPPAPAPLPDPAPFTSPPPPTPVLGKRPVLPPRPATVKIQSETSALPPPPASPSSTSPAPLGAPEPLNAPRTKPPFVPLKKSPPSISIPPEEPAPDVPEAPVASAPVTPPSAPKRGIFSVLPIFRRKETPAAKEPAPEAKIDIAPLPLPVLPVDPTAKAPPSIEPPLASIFEKKKIEKEPAKPELTAPIPPPPERPHLSPPVVSTDIEKILPSAKSEPTLPPPAVIPSTARLVETEHLPKKSTASAPAPADTASQEGLQSLFLTEEYLSVERVLELCSDLPGITSCVLSRDATVVAAHNVPDSIDLVSLSAHAMEMLRAMRTSSAKMGLGAIPAVTIHSEKGPVSFFNREDLCLCVLHKDRGFVPGVREKLHQVLVEISRGPLELPVGPKRPA